MNYVYPPDAITVSKLVNQVGTTTMVSVPVGETYTVLGVHIGQSVSTSTLTLSNPGKHTFLDSRIDCHTGDSSLLASAARGVTSHALDLMQFKCNNDIDLVVISSLGGTVAGNPIVPAVVTYVPYDINSMNDHATNTPLTSYKFVNHGVEYSYNPNVAIVSVSILTLFFIAFVVWLIKVFLKL